VTGSAITLQDPLQGFSRRSATFDPVSRRAIRAGTIGARTKPSTAQAPNTPMVSRCCQDCPISTLTALAGSRAERMPRPSQYIGKFWAIHCSHSGRAVIG